jgi:hypothetical protein
MGSGKTDPETSREAQTWQTTLNLYLADGLCHRCAAQAAWGHQNGFSLVRPPCQVCRPIVDTFPVPAGKDSPWRRFPRGRERHETPASEPERPVSDTHDHPPSDRTPLPVGVTESARAA